MGKCFSASDQFSRKGRKRSQNKGQTGRSKDDKDKNTEQGSWLTKEKKKT